MKWWKKLSAERQTFRWDDRLLYVFCSLQGDANTAADYFTPVLKLNLGPITNILKPNRTPYADKNTNPTWPQLN